MVAVPAETPVTRPDALTVATAVLLLLHTPPEVAFEYCVVEPTQTVFVPVVAATTGKAFTVTSLVTAVEQLLELVTV